MDVTESILGSVKEQLGIIDPTLDVFDPNIIMNINSAIAVLTQLGIGPKDGYAITGASETYADFLGDNPIQIGMVKIYLYLKTKMVFDNASLTSGLIEALKSQIAELEWRLRAQVESIEEKEVENSK